jgi:nucleotide-binding universal stress UspA family protein
MAKPILAGYDPRGKDHTPVDFGVAAARFTGAPLIVVSVQAAPALQSIGQVDDDLLTDCRQAVEEIERDLEAAALPVPVECRVLQSTSAARALLEAASEEDAGLIVVGSSRRSTVGRVLAGSTAVRLLHGAPCPVAAVPPGWTGDGKLTTIGVGYTDSEESREALRGAHALARRAGATLRVITVVTVGLEKYAETEPAVAGQAGKDRLDVEGEQLLRAERALRREVEALDGDVPVEVEALLGDPAEILIGVSEHLDLLVCGARGYGPLRAVLLGSVTRRVTADARCPVIVLPGGVKASLEALITSEPATTAPV